MIIINYIKQELVLIQIDLQLTPISNNISEAKLELQLLDSLIKRIFCLIDLVKTIPVSITKFELVNLINKQINSLIEALNIICQD